MIALSLLHDSPNLPSSQLRVRTQRLLCHTLFQHLWGHLWGQQGPPVKAPPLSAFFAKEIDDKRPHFPAEDVLAVKATLIHSLQQLFWSLSGLTAESLGQAYEHCLGLTLPNTDNPPNHKKIGGVYYTPTAIVDLMVHETVGKRLADLGNRPSASLTLRIVDPACGSGIFLLRAYHYLLHWYRDRCLTTQTVRPSPLIQTPDGAWRLTLALRQQILLNHIHGVDIDPQAVEITRLSLWLKLFEDGQISDLEDAAHPPFTQPASLNRNIRCGNALIHHTANQPLSRNGEEIDSTAAFNWSLAFPTAIQAGGFDVVLSNPPYIDSETMTSALPSLRKYCNAHYRTAMGNWDLFCIFIEKGIDLCKSCGLVSMIVPNKLASAHYAAQTRALLAVENQLKALWDYSSKEIFAVAVYPLIYVAAKTPPDKNSTVCYPTGSLPYTPHFTQPEIPWPLSPNLDAMQLTARLRRDFPCLANMAQVVGAASVADAYHIHALIQEQPHPQPGDLRLINSGTIDRYCMLWGLKPCRYLGSSYRCPIIPNELRRQLSERRRDQASQPKIVVAGLTKYLECVLDPVGEVLAGKSTTLVLAEHHLAFLLGVLNSKLMKFYVTQVFGGNSLQGGYLRIGPPQLRQLPIPPIPPPSSSFQGCHQRLVSLVTQIQSLVQAASNKGAVAQSRIPRIESEIDQIVCTLYGLSETEIEVVDATVKAHLGAEFSL